MFEGVTDAVSFASNLLIISRLHLRHHCGEVFVKSIDIRPTRPKWPDSLGSGSQILKPNPCF